LLRKNSWQTAKWLGQIIITLALLYVAGRKVDPLQFWAYLRNFPVYFFILIPLILVLDILINSWRVKSLYGYYGVTARLRDVFFIKFHGLFFSLAFPLLGDAYKIQSFKILNNASYAKNTLVVLIDRLIYTFSLTLVLIPFWWLPVIKVPQAFKLALLVLLAVEALIILAINNVALFNLSKKLAAKIGYRGALGHTEFAHREGYARMIGINTVAAGLRHGLMGLMYLLICYTLMRQVNFHVWGFIAGVFSIMISRIIPVSVGGIGLREYVAVMVFPQTGISEELAFSTAFLMSSILIIQGLLGGLSFLGWKMKDTRCRKNDPVESSDETDLYV